MVIMMRTAIIIGAVLVVVAVLPWFALAQMSGGASNPLPGNVALLDVNQAFTKGQAVTPVSGGSVSGTVIPDASTGNDFTYTLTGNITLANPANLSAGQSLNFDLTQDATGSRTLTLGSEYVAAGGVASIVLSTAANAEDYLTCRSISTVKLVCSLLSSISH